MKHKNNGNRYNDDFRKMVVDSYHSGQKVKDLSSEYGVSEITIYAWIKKFAPMELEEGSSKHQMITLNYKNKCLSYQRKMIS